MAKSIHAFMLILILHVLVSALANKFSSFSLNDADDCSLLFKFKETMSINKEASLGSRAYPKLASWNRSNCCLWDGVECRFGHVIGLDFSSCFLYGPISSNNSLFNLIHLRTLNLADNDFSSSQIPSGIGQLLQLANLNLSYSRFSGEVPKQISQLRKLVSLDLTGNGYRILKLQSSDFQNLVHNSSETLRELFLADVKIDSELPTSIGNLTHLNILKLRNCGLTGTLHASVSNLTQLIILDLGNNFFSGPFPSGIFNLQTLQVLDVQGNNLTGYIPEFHGSSKLKQLIVAFTSFQGSIPASIGNLTHLNILDLSGCAFMGTLPASTSNLARFTVLNLMGNEFTGSLPSSIGNLTQLRKLRLSYNGMIGQIPSSFSNLTQLTDAGLSHNKFTGSLPSLENFSNLTYLSLSYNNFDRWKLPDWFGQLNKITDLLLYDVCWFRPL